MNASDDRMDSGGLKEAINRALDREPPAPKVDFEAAGRRRLRHRAVTILGSVVAAVVFGAIAFPAASGLLAHDSEDEPPAASDPGNVGWREIRWEYGSVSYDVPPDWQPGNPSQWCSQAEESPRPFFITPDMGGSTSVLCIAPQYWFGASIEPVEAAPTLDIGEQPSQYKAGANPQIYPEGSWIARVALSPSWVLTVVAETSETAQTIVESVRKSP